MSNMVTGDDTMTAAAEARKLLDEDKRRRGEAFLEYVKAGERQFRCRLEAIPYFTQDGRVAVHKQVIAED